MPINHQNLTSNIKSNSQRGFTLIELIMVIVILAVLSAFALPRFANLKSNADEAVIDGFGAAWRSSLSIHKAAWFASGKSSNVAGYNALTNPTGALTGITIDNIAHDGDCRLVWMDLIDSTETLPFLSGINNWAAGHSGETWALNGSQIALLGEGSDIYCHYIHTSSRSAAGFAAMFRYNVVTGEFDQQDWPYIP